MSDLTPVEQEAHMATCKRRVRRSADTREHVCFYIAGFGGTMALKEWLEPRRVGGNKRRIKALDQRGWVKASR